MRPRGLAVVLSLLLLLPSAPPTTAQAPPPEALAQVRIARAREVRAFTERSFQHLIGGPDCPRAVYVSYAHSQVLPDTVEQWYHVSQVWGDLALAPPGEPLARCWANRGFTFLDRMWDRTQPTGGFFARADLLGERMLTADKWADDNSVAGLAWMEAAVRAPDLLERELMLGRARATADFLMIGGLWDETFGGGFWWNTTKGATIEGKPAQTNALAAEFFLALYGVTGEPVYRDWALKVLGWIEAKLYDPRAQLYRWSVHYRDLERRQGEVVASRFFNYDQGIMIEVYVLANRFLGGDPAHLERARSIARRLDPVFWQPERGGYVLEAGVQQVFAVYSAWVSQSLLMLYERDPNPYWMERAAANVDALDRVLWDPGHGGYFHRHFACGERSAPGCEGGASWSIDPRKHTVDQAWMQRAQALIAATLLGRSPFRPPARP